jgi:hypothetical protein
MPRYRFIVHAFEVIDDPDGAPFPDDPTALAEALKIIRELKRDEIDHRGWSLELREGERLVARIPFETVD